MHTKILHKKTKDSITVTVANDGGKNAVLVVSGTITNVDDSVFKIIDLPSFAGNPTSIRLDSISHMVESGLKCYIQYKDKPYIFPVEGRGKFDLGVAGGLQGHEIELVLTGVGSFFLILDISKIGV